MTAVSYSRTCCGLLCLYLVLEFWSANVLFQICCTRGLGWGGQWTENLAESRWMKFRIGVDVEGKVRSWNGNIPVTGSSYFLTSCFGRLGAWGSLSHTWGKRSKIMIAVGLLWVLWLYIVFQYTQTFIWAERKFRVYCVISDSLL